MNEKTPESKRLSMSNTKKEMLDAYHGLLKELKEKKEAELKPEKKIEERKAKEVVAIADSLSTEGVEKGISNLRLEIGRMLTEISDRMEGEVNEFKGIQKAIEVKEKEFQEVFEIERSAETLAALIESQNLKRQEFESEMAKRKEALNEEIDTTRAEWEKEGKDYEAEIKKRDVEEKKRREREKEEFTYTFNREQELARDEFEDEKLQLEKELREKKEQVEKELAERERQVAAKEMELEELRKQVGNFPEEMAAAVDKAIKETAARINLETKNKVELQVKGFDGERNVLTTRIESLEKTVKEQNEQIGHLSDQLEKGYQKVQDIAVKAVEGSSNVNLQQLIREQSKAQPQER